MIQAAFPNLGSTLVEDTWQEQAAKAYCLLVENCYQAGIKVSQVETSDITAAETETEALSAYLKTWFDGNVVAASEGDPLTALNKSYIPDIASFTFLAATGQWGLIFVLFVKVGLEFLLDSTEKKLDPDTSTGDTSEVLKQTLALLDEDGNIIGSRVDMLSELTITINNQLEEIRERWSIDTP